MGVFIIIDTLVLCLLNHSKNAELLNHTDNKSVNKYEKIISNISLISRQECRHTKLGETYTGTAQYMATVSNMDVYLVLEYFMYYIVKCRIYQTWMRFYIHVTKNGFQYHLNTHEYQKRNI